MEPIIKQSVGGVVSTWHYVAETAVPAAELSGVTGTAFTPGGGLLVEVTPIVPTSDGRMDLAISASAAGTAYEWCRAHFRYSFDGRIYTQDVWFHIAASGFDIPLHYDELRKFQPDIGDYAWSGDEKFAGQRDTSLDELYARLLNAGRRPWAILNRSALNLPLAWLWLSHIFSGLSRAPEDSWWRRSADCREKFETAFTAVNLIEAPNDSVDVAGAESRPLGRTRLKRG